MSNYGSYPGPPQEPWGRQPQEPYGQPADPWGGQQPDPWGGTPSSTPPAGPASPAGYPGYDQGGYDQGGYQQPGYQQGGYDRGYEQSPGYGSTRQYEQQQYEQPGYGSVPPTDPVWGQPVPPPPRKGGSRTLILVVVALALLVVAGGVAAVVKLGGSDDNPGGALPTSSQAADPSGQPDPSGDASPAPENSTDARFVKAGQCVVNEGTDAKPELKIVACGDETFEVLARFDGTIDFEAKCKTVEGYQFHYFFDSELNPLDFVLCLKQR
jgi:hypothetical protein